MARKDAEWWTITIAVYVVLVTFFGSTIVSWVRPAYKLPDGFTWLMAVSIGFFKGLKILRGGSAGIKAELGNDDKDSDAAGGNGPGPDKPR